MKKLSKLFESKLQVIDGSLNFIPKESLEKYLKVANKFLSDDAKTVINWLIDNNNYIDILGPDADNSVAAFYNRGIPSDPELKKLYTALAKVVKANRIMEIPTFQDAEIFNGIINKTISPDEVILDLETEKGRNEIAKKYDKMIWKIARGFLGKSNLTLDDMYEAGLEGVVYAMNHYGKKSNMTKSSTESIKSYTFSQYVSMMIRTSILEAIKHTSHIVRIPVSQQNKERAETGRNTKTFSTSGDAIVGHDKDGNGKTMFDLMSDAAGFEELDDLDSKDAKEIWSQIYKRLEKEFPKNVMDIWYSFNELNGRKKVSNKDLAKKYGIVPSNVTYNIFKVNKFIQTDKKMKNLFAELYELTR